MDTEETIGGADWGVEGIQETCIGNGKSSKETDGEEEAAWLDEPTIWARLECKGIVDGQCKIWEREN